MKAGDLPRLSAIRDESHFSCLKSVIPPHTAPGWNLDHHGREPRQTWNILFLQFFYFAAHDNQHHQHIDSKNLGLRRSFDERSVVVNVPVTYPVHKISGSIVSGIPPWYIDKSSVYPNDLLKKLKSENYEIDTPMSKSLRNVQTLW